MTWPDGVSGSTVTRLPVQVTRTDARSTATDCRPLRVVMSADSSSTESSASSPPMWAKRLATSSW